MFCTFLVCNVRLTVLSVVIWQAATPKSTCVDHKVGQQRMAPHMGIPCSAFYVCLSQGTWCFIWSCTLAVTGSSGARRLALAELLAILLGSSVNAALWCQAQALA